MGKKAFFLAAIVLCSGILIQSAHATKVRDMGLGVYEHSWMIDKVETHIYENPAYLSEINNRIFFVRTDDNSGGLIFSPVKYLNLGVFSGMAIDNDLWNTTGPTGFFHTGDGNFDIRANEYKPLASNNPGGDTIDLLDPDGNSSVSSTASDYREKLDQQDISLMGSYILGKMAFGLNIGYASSWADDKYEQTQPDIRKDEWGFWNVQLDVIAAWLFALKEDMTVDAALGYTLYQIENKYNASTPGIETKLKYETDGAMDITGIAGFHWELSNMYKMHVNAGFGILNRSTRGTGVHTNSGDVTENINANEQYKREGQELKLGASMELRISESATSFVGFDGKITTFKYNYSGTDTSNAATDANKYSSETRIIEVPLVMGIEGKLSENWTGRFSLSHNLWDPSYKTEDRITNSGSTDLSFLDDNDTASDTALNLGLSYKLGNFTFDWLMNVDIFVEGPYILSGKQTNTLGVASTPISTALAATYLFDTSGKNETPSRDKKTILEN